jgi:hypothetical protein
MACRSQPKARIRNVPPAAAAIDNGATGKAKGGFFVVQVNRRDGDVFAAPPATAVVGEGDGIVLIGRRNRSAILTALFEPRIRTDRG